MIEIIYEVEMLMIRQQSLEAQYQGLRQVAGDLYNESAAIGAQLNVLLEKLTAIRDREAGDEWKAGDGGEGDQ